MKARLGRIRLRDLALFLVVVVAVAVAALFAAREAGLGDRSAVAETEPLTLSLSAPEICETKAARHRSSSQLRTNEDGVRVRQSVTIGWNAETELPVRWQVSGGTPPYALVIDGETRDVKRAYQGAFGIAVLGCGASGASGTFFEERHTVTGVQRFYRLDPQIDSGLQSIRAVVTEASGATAEATVEVYVIYVTGSHKDLLRGGNTYRVFGHLITIPDGLDMRIGDRISGSGGDPVQTFYIEGTDPFVVIWLNARTFREVNREVPSEDRSGARDRSDYSESELREFHAAFDQFARSVDQPPNLDRGER